MPDSGYRPLVFNAVQQTKTNNQTVWKPVPVISTGVGPRPIPKPRIFNRPSHLQGTNDVVRSSNKNPFTILEPRDRPPKSKQWLKICRRKELTSIPITASSPPTDDDGTNNSTTDVEIFGVNRHDLHPLIADQHKINLAAQRQRDTTIDIVLSQSDSREIKSVFQDDTLYDDANDDQCDCDDSVDDFVAFADGVINDQCPPAPTSPPPPPRPPKNQLYLSLMARTTSVDDIDTKDATHGDRDVGLRRVERHQDDEAEDYVAVAEIDAVGARDGNMRTLAVESSTTFSPMLAEVTNNTDENGRVEDDTNNTSSRTFSMKVDGQVITRKYPPPPTTPPPPRPPTPHNQMLLPHTPTPPPPPRSLNGTVLEDRPGRIFFYTML